MELLTLPKLRFEASNIVTFINPDRASLDAAANPAAPAPGIVDHPYLEETFGLKLFSIKDTQLLISEI